MFYIYILYSQSAQKYYVGNTVNFSQRLNEHDSQRFFNTYTSKFRPWVMRAVFECGEDEETAVKLERFIKKQKSQRLIIKRSRQKH